MKPTNETNRLSQPKINLLNTNNEQQIQKVVFELIQTERSYVQVSK
jgi:hypothetical protein